MGDSAEGVFDEYENPRTALIGALRAVDEFLDGLRIQAAALFAQADEAQAKLADFGGRIDKLERKPVEPPA